VVAAAGPLLDHRGEDELAAVVGEEAEQRGRGRPGAEAAEEGRLGDDAAPAPADERGARERVARREAEEDLGEEVVVVQRRKLGGGGGEGAALGGGDQALLLGHFVAVGSSASG
jgi:hypothetical protein